VQLTARGMARVRGRHPWVLRDGAGAGPTGPAAVRVLDERGRPVASALWAPPPAPIALRVYARGEAFVPFDERLLSERIAAAGARRAAFGLGESYRLVHGEADGLPGLFVDRWGDAAVVQAGTGVVDALEGVIARLLDARLVVARDDGSMRDHEGLPRRKGVLLGDGPTTVRVREGKAVLELDLLEDAKTGGFLDQQGNHARAGELARGEALDAFTYHGGFALAMAPRAASVLAFDQDARAVERARRNAAASGFANVEVRVADAFVALRELERTGRAFDTVVIDPPALAKRGKGPVEQALRAYRELNLRAFRITRPGGTLVTCSCSGKVTPALFGEMLVAAARDAGRDAVVVERRGAGPDHPVLLGVPETEYLKCWVLQVT
jgi:23S rRNA (cytosine1962-C5)-methyltransferase